MKIRQALKLYNKSKCTLLKARNIYEEGTMLTGYSLRFEQYYPDYRDCKVMYKNGRKYKLYRFFEPINNSKAYHRVIKYLKNNKLIRLVDYFPKSVRFDVILNNPSKYINNLPKIGEYCYAYDDGKIRKSRESQLKIINIIPFSMTSKEIKDMWESENKIAYFVFSCETDYIIEAEKENEEKIYFARMLDGDWFSLNECLLLDTLGEYHKRLIRKMQEELLTSF